MSVLKSWMEAKDILINKKNMTADTFVIIFQQIDLLNKEKLSTSVK